MGEIRKLIEGEEHLAIKGDVDLHNALLDEQYEYGYDDGFLSKEKEVAVNCYNNGVSKEIICKSLNISLDKLEEYLSDTEN